MRDHSGYVRDGELEAIKELLARGRLAHARGRASALIARPENFFQSPKRAQFMKATAFYLRGSAAALARERAEAIRDFKSAAELGHALAMSQVAENLISLGLQTSEMATAARFVEEAWPYLSAGAQLGDPKCMDLLGFLYRGQHRTLEANYWFFLARVTTSLSEERRLAEFSQMKLTAADQSVIAEALGKHSVSGGPVPTVAAGVPGRSVRTAALVDALMRRRLEFVWRAFFTDSGPAVSVLEVFRKAQNSLPNNPVSSVYLLVPPGPTPERPGILSLRRRRDLMASVLPGDEIMIRCGRLAHVATVWATRAPAGRMLLLDPFFEFWQPSHNRCITEMSIVPYGSRRELLSIKRSEIEPILAAVITVRDRR
jgi:hypothetical protein